MEIALAIIGGITAVVAALAGLLAGVNYLIKVSRLLANDVWELKKYGLKRRRKDGSVPLS